MNRNAVLEYARLDISPNFLRRYYPVQVRGSYLSHVLHHGTPIRYF